MTRSNECVRIAGTTTSFEQNSDGSDAGGDGDD